MKINQNEIGLISKVVSDLGCLSKASIRNLYYKNDVIELNKELKYTLPAVGCEEVEFIYLTKTNQITANALNGNGDQVLIKTENLPQELREISNLIQFNKFLKNAYAKVTALSDGEYKLYINQRLLGGDKEYLHRMLCSIQELLISRTKSSGETLQILNIEHNSYSEVADNILVPVISLAAAAAIEMLKQGRISVDTIDSVHFKDAIDAGIFCKQKQLIDSNTYELLFPISNGLEGLKNKIYNKEDPFTIHAVECFLNSIGKQLSSKTIEEKLKDEKFISNIYITLIKKTIDNGRKAFIAKFKEYEVQVTPIQEERSKYQMPPSGICHGSSLVSSKLGENFSDRAQILSESTLFQQRYHEVRNPDQDEVYKELISKITQAVANLEIDEDEKPPLDIIKKLVDAKSKDFQEFLKANNIDVSLLFVEARTNIQGKIISKYPELQIFSNAEEILPDIKYDTNSLIHILDSLSNKTLESEGDETHMALITFVEKADITKAMQNIHANTRIPQAHDILIRVDTNGEGNIKRLIFSDLQETGIHIVLSSNKPSKLIKEAIPNSIELVSSYEELFARRAFGEISAKYTKIRLIYP